MQKIIQVLSLILVLLTIMSACKKEEKKEVNLDVVVDYHLSDFIHHTLELGVLPYFYDTSFQFPDTNISMLKVDTIMGNLVDADRQNPVEMVFFYNEQKTNPTGRIISGKYRVWYYGPEQDSISFSSESIIADGLETTVSGSYHQLSQDQLFGTTRVELMLNSGALIINNGLRSIIKSIGSDGVINYSAQQVTMTGNFSDRNAVVYEFINEGKLLRRAACKHYFNNNLRINKQGEQEFTAEYPVGPSCNGLTRVSNGDDSKNIRLF